jgi:hypothetical protein
MIDDLKQLNLKHWGFATFRPLQDEAMRAVLEGRDSLLVLPTGGGDSIGREEMKKGAQRRVGSAFSPSQIIMCGAQKPATKSATSRMRSFVASLGGRQPARGRKPFLLLHGPRPASLTPGSRLGKGKPLWPLPL